MAKRARGWVVGAGCGCPSQCGYFNQMLAPNGITCGRGRVGSHRSHRPRERPFPLPLLLFLQRFELDTLLRFLESLEQGWGCGGGAVLINESGQRHVESGPGRRGGGGANWELGEEAVLFRAPDSQPLSRQICSRPHLCTQSSVPTSVHWVLLRPGSLPAAFSAWLILPCARLYPNLLPSFSEKPSLNNNACK